MPLVINKYMVSLLLAKIGSIINTGISKDRNNIIAEYEILVIKTIGRFLTSYKKLFFSICLNIFIIIMFEINAEIWITIRKHKKINSESLNDKLSVFSFIFIHMISQMFNNFFCLMFYTNYRYFWYLIA